MKYSLTILFVVGILVTGLQAFPGSKRDREDNDKSEGLGTILILEDANPFEDFFHDSFPLKTDRDDESEEKEQNSWKFFPFRRPELNYDDIFSRMMTQLNQLLSNIPPVNKFSPGIDIPAGSSNTTSETKVIDGHVVTVNQTTYNHVNDTHTAIFRFKIVDVKPQNETVIDDEANRDVETVTMPSETSTSEKSIEESSTTEGRSVETIEDFDSDNEIPEKVKML